MQKDQTRSKSEENSSRTRKLDASLPALENMRFSNHRYMGKVFQRLQKKLRSAMKAAIHFGQDSLRNWEISKNTRFENIENVFNITQKMNKRTFRRNSECGRPGIFVTIMDEINIGQRPSDLMGEGKSLCLRRLRFMCWSDGTRSRSRRKKMERPSRRSQDVFIISRCSGYRWRSN